MDKVRVALVGAGNMANSVHYPSLAKMDDVEMVGLCDLMPEKLAETAEKFKIEKTFSDYKKMLEETSPDAVYVLMPPYHLWDLALHVMSEKRHLFIEKPPGVTTYQTKALARAAEKNGIVSMAGFQRRFIPIIRKLKEEVEKQAAINACVATFYKKHDGGPYYGGAIDILYCDCIHAVDAIRWMAGGEVKSVASDVRCLHSEFETSYYALITFENDVTGVLLGNWKTGGRVFSVEMHSYGASAFVDPDEGGVLTVDGEKQQFNTEEVAGSDEQCVSHGFYQENRHFIDCVKSGQQPINNLDDAIKTMELVDMIVQKQI